MNIKELDKQHFSSEDTEEYKEFIEKFKPKPKPKRTTDDCYTPPEVYEVVKEWVVWGRTPAGFHYVYPQLPRGG